MVVAEEIPTRAGVLTALPVATLTSDQAADAMSRSFEGYLVPISMDGPAFERRFGPEHLDRYLSEVYTADGELVGISLVTRRGTTARIGGFGCTPAYRGRGVGRALMDRAVRRCTEAGATTLTLEVIVGNAAAQGLYEKLGFRVARTLVGYRWEPTGAEPAIAEPQLSPSPHGLTEIDPVRFARGLSLDGAQPPWQLAPETLAAAVPPRRAYALGPATALVGVTEDAVSVVAVHTDPAARRQGHARALLGALRATFPGRNWVVPAIVPEDAGAAFFAATGWVRADLAQYEMVRANPF
ncbi:GNAT family N-acetyltransferase [Jiangella mangrovi]|uniref:Ribosomal protein S18 acetylase RimI-like enzyme n=1 Tax=Jiangella mangrovi TaxID=1524084 RepID=A0A7W9LLI2_9ACTN|nr:GNAT family N-acetyltransferase [Jiangella mangrovi]MBB5788174.1 ribosomal protein S18 acetylase RimI-like enzyme [Jiangella mangrovi]